VFCFRREDAVPYTLEQVDLVRERMGVGYKEAKRALDGADGDVISALAALEDEQCVAPDKNLEKIIVDIAEEVKSSIAGREITQIRVKLCDQTVREVPVALAGVGAAFVTLLTALLAYLTLELVSDDRQADSEARYPN